MSLLNLGRESALSFYRQREAVAGVLSDATIYSRMLEDEALEVLNAPQH